MTEAELGEIVVKLTGDGSSYQKMLVEAIEATKRAQQQVAENAKKVESFQDTLNKLGASIAAAFAASHMYEKLKEAKHEWYAAELVAIKLNATLEANGRSVKELSEDYANFATELEKTTIVADDTTLTMLKTAETMQLTGDKAKQAVRDAIAIGAANDSSGESFMRLTAAMQRGDTETAMHMARMVPQLRGIRDLTEFTARYAKVVEQGTKAAEAEAQSGSGRVKQMANAYNNLQEDFGKLFAEMTKPLQEAKLKSIEFMRSLHEEDKKAIVYLTGIIAALLTIGPLLQGLAIYARVAAAGFAMLKTTTGMWATTATLGIAAGIALAKVLYDSDKNVKELNKSLEKNKDITSKMGDVHSKRTETIIQKAEGLQGKEKVDFLTEEARKAAQEIEGIKRNIAATELESAKLNNSWKSLYGIIENAQVGVNDQNVADMNEKLRLQQERLQKIKNLQIEASAAAENSKGARIVEELNKQLNEQYALLGMEGTELEIYKAKLAGATDEQLRASQELAALVEAKRKDVELEKERKAEAETRIKLHKDTLSTLQDEIATMGMSASQTQIYNLAKEGLTAAQIEEVRVLQMQKSEAEKQMKLQEDGKRLMEEYASPVEKYAKKVKELQALYNSGSISQDVFNKALGDTNAQFDQASIAAATASSQIQMLDAVMNKSASARQKVNDFLEKHKAMVGATAERENALRPKAGPNVPRYEPGQGDRPASQDTNGLFEVGRMLVPWLQKLVTNTGKKEQTWTDIALTAVESFNNGM